MAGPFGRPYGREARSRTAVSQALATVAFELVSCGISSASERRTCSSGAAASANDVYASPNGAGDACTKAVPCSLEKLGQAQTQTSCGAHSQEAAPTQVISLASHWRFSKSG